MQQFWRISSIFELDPVSILMKNNMVFKLKTVFFYRKHRNLNLI